MNKSFLEIDGSYGEGGGQILRTALSLSCITGIPVNIINIRKNRKKPGLMPQHLTCVKIMKMLFNAETKGDELNSQSLYFKPNEFMEKDFFYDIGTAGSTSLVLQTILPCLVYYKSNINVTLKGGTHVPMSPIFDYLNEVFKWHLEKLGIFVDFLILDYGFYPKGGGEVRMQIKRIVEGDSTYQFTDRGKLLKISSRSCVSNLPLTIAERQKDSFLRTIGDYKGLTKIELSKVTSIGKGTYIFAKAVYENSLSGFSSLGAIGKPAEVVGEEAGRAFLEYEKQKGFYDEYMADQILIYLALFTKGSKITIPKETEHFKTNLWVIKKFIDVSQLKVEN